MRIVFDTNVLVAAARSRQGASFAVVSSIPASEFQPCLSVEFYAEWQEVLTRPENLPRAARLKMSCVMWRPFLPDADDDMVLELAFATGCRHIVTHNVKDFHGSEQLGVAAVTPRDFLNLIRTRT